MSSGPPQISEETFGMETTGSGSLQTSPLGDGAVNGSGSLGPHRLLQHRGNQCKVACSARFSWLQPARPLAPPALNTGTLCPLDTLSFTHRGSLGVAPSVEEGVCSPCAGTHVDLLCKIPAGVCVCPQTHRRLLPSLTGGTEFQSCGEQHRALWERT